MKSKTTRRLPSIVKMQIWNHGLTETQLGALKKKFKNFVVATLRATEMGQVDVRQQQQPRKPPTKRKTAKKKSKTT